MTSIVSKIAMYVSQSIPINNLKLLVKKFRLLSNIFDRKT